MSIHYSHIMINFGSNFRLKGVASETTMGTGRGGTVNRRGYGDQALCDARGPCLSI